MESNSKCYLGQNRILFSCLDSSSGIVTRRERLAAATGYLKERFLYLVKTSKQQLLHQ